MLKYDLREETTNTQRCRKREIRASTSPIVGLARINRIHGIVDFASGWKVDLILRKNRPFSRAEFDRRVPTSLLDVPVFIASVEDTIVAKLEWSKMAGGSERQRRDVAGIIAAQGTNLDRAYIERWALELDLSEEWATSQTVVP